MCCIFANKSKYEGQVKNGRMAGIGAFIKEDGKRLEGEFKNNIAQGNFVITRPDGYYFKGNVNY